MVYNTCSHWTEAFPWRQATASSVAKILLEKIIPTWGTPLELHSDRGTHFTGQVFGQVCASWLVWRFHCASHPQPSGLVEHTNGMIKTHLAKLVETLQIPWTKALPPVLNHRSTLPLHHRLCQTGRDIPCISPSGLINSDLLRSYRTSRDAFGCCFFPSTVAKGRHMSIL